MDELVSSITPQSAFIPKHRVRVVIHPNGTRSLVPYPNAPIPQNILKFGNLNKNTMNAYFGSNHPSGYTLPNVIRIHGKKRGATGVNQFRASKAALIRFIVAAYYSYIDDPLSNPDAMFYFRRAYAKLSTRNWRNNSKIPVTQLYRLLSSLNIPTLKKLAVILEW